MRQHISYFKRACYSVRREILYDVLMECGVVMKLVRLIKLYLNEQEEQMNDLSS
jgi:hypothetical protein